MYNIMLKFIPHTVHFRYKIYHCYPTLTETILYTS